MADAPILSNPLKEMMKAGKVALGMNVRLARSGDIARIAKSSGHDFIFIDGQHAIFNLETITHIAHTALGCGITPIARVKQRRRPGRAGAAGQRRDGHRLPGRQHRRRGAPRPSLAPSFPRWESAPPPAPTRCSITGPMPAARPCRALNDSTLVVCMIETPEGVKNVEEIAKVDGVDVIHIGSNDLLTAMGKPGRVRRSGRREGHRSRHLRYRRERQDPRHGRRPQPPAPGGVHPQGRALHHDQQRDRVHHGRSDAGDDRATAGARGEIGGAFSAVSRNFRFAR